MPGYGLNRPFQGAGNFETEHQRTLTREVCAAVQTGRLVVVSGLVGSGKTHLLRRIEAELTKARKVSLAKSLASSSPCFWSDILSRLLMKYEASGNAKALALITQTSPAAWRHILLNGHYTFQSDGKMVDLDALVAGLELG